MATVALEDVVKQLQLNRRSTDDVMKTLKEWLQMQKNAILDNLEKEQEEKKERKKDRKAGKGSTNSKASFWGMLMSPKFWLKGLIAIPAALTALVVGLAGWRLGWFKTLKFTIKSLKWGTAKIFSVFKFFLTPIFNVMRNVKNGLLKMFGLNSKGKQLSKTKGMWKAILKVSIIEMYNKFLMGLTKVFKVVKGLSIFTGGSGRGAKIMSGFKSFGGWLKMVFGLVKSAGSGMSRILKPFMGFLKFGGRLFMGVFKKILWPIGIIFGLFAGVKAFMNSSESSFLGKMGDFMGGFFADFIGMPLQLLQSVVNWIMKKIFSGSVNADGSWDVTTGVGKFMNAFKEFDIKAMIHKIYKAPFKIIEGVIWFFGNIFTDPKGTIKTMWQGLLRMFGISPTSETPILDLIFAVIDGAVALIKNMFGWNSEDDKPKATLREVITKGFNAVFEFTRMIFPNIMFSVKTMWAKTMFKVKSAFMNFGEFIRKIPDRLFAIAKNTLGYTSADEYAAEMKAIGKPTKQAELEYAYIEAELASKIAELQRNWMTTKYGAGYMGNEPDMNEIANRGNAPGTYQTVIDNSVKIALNDGTGTDVFAVDVHMSDQYLAALQGIGGGGGITYK